jgi:hypothetical protein
VNGLVRRRQGRGRPCGKERGKECVGKAKADNGGSRDLGSVDLEMDLGEKFCVVSISRFWGCMTMTGRWRGELSVAWRGEFGRELPKRKRTSAPR